MTFRAFLLAFCAVAIAMPAIADQSPLSSPTTGTVSGLTLTTNFNSAINALATCNSGASAPANTQSGLPGAGQCWLNTSASRYKLEIFDGAQWVVEAQFDPSIHLWMPQIGGGAGSLASAATTDLGSAAETYLTVTGTTAITSFGATAPAGSVKIVNAQSAGLVLTYNATSLITPGRLSITTQAGDQFIAVALGGGDWTIASYLRADGSALQHGYTAPQMTVLSSGSGTYTVPAGAIYLRVTAHGGGGSGAAGAYSGYGGGATTFGSVTNLGGGGAGIFSSGLGGAGGVVITGTGFTETGSPGGTSLTAYSGEAGGSGGASGPSSGTVGQYAISASVQQNAGPGAGSGGNQTGYNAGGGGGGAYADAIIANPAASYTYSIGAGGAAASTSGAVGAPGGSGQIIIKAYFQ